MRFLERITNPELALLVLSLLATLFNVARFTIALISKTYVNLLKSLYMVRGIAKFPPTPPVFTVI